MASINPFYRLKASSLLEIVVAMVVIIVVFGLAMMIFNNIIRSSLSMNKIKARALVQTELLKAEKNRATDSVFTSDDISCKRTVTTYQNNSSVRVLQVVALDIHSDTLALGRKVVIVR